MPLYFTGAVSAQGEGFDWNRLGWYGPQPPLGAILGALIYVAIRGGLLAASSGASAVNIFDSPARSPSGPTLVPVIRTRHAVAALDGIASAHVGLGRL